MTIGSSSEVVKVEPIGISTGSGDSYAAAIAAYNGQAAITGYYTGQVILGGITLNQINTDGSLVTARWIPGSGFQQAMRGTSISAGSAKGHGVAMDISGNIYVVGEFSGHVGFVDATGATASLITEISDFFVVRYKQNGAFDSFGIHQGNLDLTGDAIGNAIAIDGTNVYVTGAFSGTMRLSSTPNITLGSLGNHDIFVAAYAQASGAVGWAQRAGNNFINTKHNHFDQGTGIAVGTAGALQIVGEFGGANEPNDAAFYGTNGLTFNHFRNVFAAKLTVLPNSPTVSGTVIAGGPWANRVVAVTGITPVFPTDYILTDAAGHYSAPLPSGSTVNVELVSDMPKWTVGSTTSYTTNLPMSNADFTLTPYGAPASDMRISAKIQTTENAVPGKKVRYLITYENVGTAPMASCILKLQHDPALVFGISKSDPAAWSEWGAGSTRFWQMHVPFLSRDRGLTSALFQELGGIAGTTAPQDGTILGSTVTLMDTSNATQRSASIYQDVVRPSDPNKKYANPDGNLSAVSVRAGQPLTYSVEYYNTGGLEAHDVIIYDTLDPNIDISAEPVTLLSSGPVTAAVTQAAGDPNLVFNFSSMSLPSIHISPGSFGFITFSVPIIPSVAVGTWIRNRAAVDFTEAHSHMLTNTVENCVAPDFSAEGFCFGAATRFATRNPRAGSYLPEWADTTDLQWNFGDDSVATGSNPQHRFTRPGIYAVTLTFHDPGFEQRPLCDLAGPVYAITKYVIIDSLRSPSLVWNQNTVTVKAEAGVRYEWFLGTSRVGSGPSFHPAAPGLYTLTTTNGNGCQTSMEFNFTPVSGVSHEIDGDISINIYPNPGTGIFTVDLGCTAISDENFSVMDMRGAVVLEGTIAGGQRYIRIDLDHQASGTYMVRCNIDGKPVARSFILQR